MNDIEKLKNHLFDIYADIFYAYSKHDKHDFYWILGYRIVNRLFDYIESYESLSLFGIRIEIDLIRADTIKLCKIMYKGKFNEKG